MNNIHMTPTDDKPMTIDALMRNTRDAWNLGQTYWQQADSESYAANKRSNLTLKQYDDLLETSRAALEQYGKEQYARGVNDSWPAGRESGEPVAWGQLGTLNGQLFLRSNYDRAPYPPPPSIVRALNLVPLYAVPQSREPLTDEQIDKGWADGVFIPQALGKREIWRTAIRFAEDSHNIRSAK